MSQYQTSPARLPATVRPPELKCLRIDGSATVLVVVAGELDIATVRQFDHVLREAESVAPQIALDLGGLDFVASCGASLLIEADARIRRAGGRLRLERVPDALCRIPALICATSSLLHDVPATASAYRPMPWRGSPSDAHRGPQLPLRAVAAFPWSR